MPADAHEVVVAALLDGQADPHPDDLECNERAARDVIAALLDSAGVEGDGRVVLDRSEGRTGVVPVVEGVCLFCAAEPGDTDACWEDQGHVHGLVPAGERP